MDDRRAAPTDQFLRSCDFFESSTQMHGRCPQAIRSLPGNGRVQSIIYFESGCAVAKFLQPTLVAAGQFLAANLEKLARSQVAEKQVIVRQRP